MPIITYKSTQEFEKDLKQLLKKLPTLREDIDYGEIPALTRRGYVGVKVWIHRKEND